MATKKPITRSFLAQLLAVVLAGLTAALPLYASDLDNEEHTRMAAIRNRAANGTMSIGDAHEAATHQRIAAARLRDSGYESKVDGYIRNSANTNSLIARCMQSQGATLSGCHLALSTLRSYGVHDSLQAAAGVAYGAMKWDGKLVMSNYYDSRAHLILANLPAPGCAGARQAADVTIIAGSVMMFFPAAQGAGAVTLFFGAIMFFAIDLAC